MGLGQDFWTAGRVAHGIDRWRVARFLSSRRSPLVPVCRRPLRLRLNVCGQDIIVYVRRSPADANVFAEVFLESCYEVPYECLIGAPETVLDLGAHIGLASAWFAARFPSARIVCVEPLPANVELLARTAKENGRAWAVVAVAVGARSGTTTLHWSQWWSSGTTVPQVGWRRRSDPRRPEHVLAQSPLEVPVVTVSDLLEQLHLDSIDVLKMDIEGAEEEVLSGQPLWLQRVRLIVADLHSKYVNVRAVEEALRGAGFLCFRASSRNKVFLRRDREPPSMSRSGSDAVWRW